MAAGEFGDRFVPRPCHPGDRFDTGDPALDQLARLHDGYGGRLHPEEPLHALALAVGRDLRAAGLELHDCVRQAPTGGVCMELSPLDGGLIVAWALHDVLAFPCGGELAAMRAGVTQVMNDAIARVLIHMGWRVEQIAVEGIVAYVVREPADRLIERGET